MERTSRRQFFQAGLALAGLGLLSGCGLLPPGVQQPAKVPVIGFLAPGTREGRAPLIAGFLQGLRDLGYVEGQNIAIEYRFSDGKDERLPELAAELVGLKVDVILVSATLATIAAKQATSTIPIVMGAAGDPAATGLVAGLAHPGGNVTGMSLMSAQLSGKRLQLLKEIIPGLSRLAVTSNETNPLHVPQDKEVQAAAQVLGIEIQRLSVQSADDLEAAFQAAMSARADAIYGATDSVVTNARTQVAELALRYRLPSLFDYRENVEAGGLVAYGPVLVTLYRRSATYVDKILKGAKPADLPVEQPTNFELFINAKTARALGLNIPQEVLMQATEVIQ